MCMGAATTLGVPRVWFALESPNDGAAELGQSWTPPTELPFFAKPREALGGIHRDEARGLFAEYAAGTGPVGKREWAAASPDRYPQSRAFRTSPVIRQFGSDRESMATSLVGQIRTRRVAERPAFVMSVLVRTA